LKQHAAALAAFFMERKTVTTEAIDYVRSKKETAKILNMSVRTLARLEKQGRAPRRTQITDRICGFRDSAIREFLNSKTQTN
jgi:predicted DNA-binding transcriptional regulator AlpA